MIDPKNAVVLTGGLVDTPEVTGNVAKFRLAMDYAGSEQNSDNRSGYFVVKFFLNNEDPNTTFVKKQIEAGNFKKGSQVQLVGRLLQERWRDQASDSPRQTVVVIADALTYAASSRATGESTAATATTSELAASVPDAF